MTSLLAGISLVLAGARLVQCGIPGPDHLHLHWSDPVQATSPNGAFEVKVLPVLPANEDSAPVVLRRCQDGAERQLFALGRDAELHWGPGGTQILVIDHPTADEYEVRVFRADPWKNSTGTDVAPSLDESIHGAIQSHVGASRQIGFYLPHMVSWENGNIVLAVGGVTYPKPTGRGVAYCYGVVVTTKTLAVQRVITAAQLRAAYSGTCRVMP